jgi:hypothetical protein
MACSRKGERGQQPCLRSVGAHQRYPLDERGRQPGRPRRIPQQLPILQRARLPGSLYSFFSAVAGFALIQALKAAPLVAPVDAAQLSRVPASAVEVRAARTAAQKTIFLMVNPPSLLSYLLTLVRTKWRVYRVRDRATGAVSRPQSSRRDGVARDSIKSVKMMDRPVAVADAEAICGRDRGTDPCLGVANRGFELVALRKASCDGRR